MRVNEKIERITPDTLICEIEYVLEPCLSFLCKNKEVQKCKINLKKNFFKIEMKYYII